MMGPHRVLSDPVQARHRLIAWVARASACCDCLPRRSVPKNKVGRAYARPRSGTARHLKENASARPIRGGLQRCLFLETGGFDLDQQPKRREIALVEFGCVAVN